MRSVSRSWRRRHRRPRQTVPTTRKREYPTAVRSSECSRARRRGTWRRARDLLVLVGHPRNRQPRWLFASTSAARFPPRVVLVHDCDRRVRRTSAMRATEAPRESILGLHRGSRPSRHRHGHRHPPSDFMKPLPAAPRRGPRLTASTCRCNVEFDAAEVEQVHRCRRRRVTWACFRARFPRCPSREVSRGAMNDKDCRRYAHGS